MLRLRGACTKDKVVGVIGVMGEAPKCAGGEHLRVRKGGVHIFNASLQGKVIKSGQK